MSFHLGCREVSLRPTPDSKDGWHTIFDQEVTFEGLPCTLEENLIESFYWDTFVEEHDTLDDKLPRKWVKDCNNPGAGFAAAGDCCPGITANGQGQDTSMGPDGNIARFVGVFTPGADGVNIWAGAFRSLRDITDAGCVIGRGQKTPTTSTDAGTAPKPVRQVSDRCRKCDGKTSYCWLGTAPLDNFWTMRWQGQYPARLHGAISGPPGAQASLIIPDQVDRTYEIGPSGTVAVDENFVIGRDSMHRESDLQLLITTDPRSELGHAIRFDADVISRPGGPIWTAGTVMHKVTFAGTIGESSEGAPAAPGPRQVPPEQLLPEGAIFASATVEPDTKIQVEQPGYALIATAEVISTKRVNSGDTLDANTTPAIHFDNGTGVVIEIAKRAVPVIAATVGLISLLDRDHPRSLPVNGGTATTYIGSNQPFTTPAIVSGGRTTTPDTTHAVFLNRDGQKIGQLTTFKGLPSQSQTPVSIQTLDASGAVLQQADVPGGILNGTPAVSFDKQVYRQNERGLLRVANVVNYEKLVQQTQFGVGELTDQPIRIVPLSDVRGLPSQVPFGNASVPFQVGRPGQARAAVILPHAVPSKPVADAGNDEALKQANAAFERWRAQFGR